MLKVYVEEDPIINKPFGRLTVLCPTEDYKTNKNKFLCKCSCGNLVKVRKGSLLSGNTKSCGCLVRDNFIKNLGKRFIDITNQKFGKLRVLELIKDKRHGNQLLWNCICDCGKPFETTSYKLRHQVVTSCGCDTPVVVTKRKRSEKAIQGQQQKLLDIIKGNVTISELYNDEDLKSRLYNILKNCWDHHRDINFERNFLIFKQRYLIPNPPTLQDIAVELNLSRERVRQIEDELLSIIRDNFLR